MPTQKNTLIIIRWIALAGCVFAAVVCAQTPSAQAQAPLVSSDTVIMNAAGMIQNGRHIFRYDTYGDEAFWGDALQLHQAIQGTQFGGVGPGVSPRTALALGLKVDVDALPVQVLNALRKGQVNLDDVGVHLGVVEE